MEVPYTGDAHQPGCREEIKARAGEPRQRDHYEKYKNRVLHGNRHENKIIIFCFPPACGSWSASAFLVTKAER